MKRTTLLSLFLFAYLFSRPQAPSAGKSFFYYQRFASAESIFHEWLRDRPDDAETWLWLTKAYLAQGNLKAAVDSLSLAPEKILDDPYYLVAAGATRLQQGNQDSARYFFTQAIDRTKGKNPFILGAIAEIVTITGKGEMNYAIELLQQAQKRDKNNAAWYLLTGDAYRNLHNGGEAFRAYSAAVEKDPHFAAAYYQLGKLFQTQKNQEMYLDYFNRAVKADPNFGPAIYELYYYYVYTQPDPAKAMDFFKQYSNLSDRSRQHDYSYIDLLYLTKDYASAIEQARHLIQSEGALVKPRLYKLVAYSYTELHDSLQAVDYMRMYFAHESDSNIIAKDCETMASLYSSQHKEPDSILTYYQMAARLSRDSAILRNYFKELARISAQDKDYPAQAKWLGLYYQGNPKASNVDLFNWGVAAYRCENYPLADSVFNLYTSRYPEQPFGYYWRARSSAAIDTTMATGLAIPHYSKLIEVISHGDTARLNPDSLSARDKKWVVEAYAYLAAYETNTRKNFEKAIEYFDKVLEVDPENADARKYIPILEANVKKEGDSN
jgi:tetratricopeptide (TPR) repeat protein